MIVDTVVKNGNIVSPWGITAKGIAIHNGRIAAITHDESLPEARRTIDAGGNYVLPGIVDVHVHVGLYHPFEVEINDMVAAAFGGSTTLGAYVGLGASAQKDAYVEGFERWQEIWNRNALVDVFFHAGIVSKNHITEITAVANSCGINSYKFFMTKTGAEVARTGGDIADDGFLWRGFQEIASLGGSARAVVHAENMDIIELTTPPVRAQGRQDLAAWDEARPGICETLDVDRAISIARVTDAPLYIVHVSNASSVAAIARAKEEGVKVVGETCPQYLILTKSAPLGPLGRINPPLRDEACQDRLWQGIREGTIECIGSDHCSTRQAEKTNLWEAPSGMPGLEALLSIMLSEGVNKGRIKLEELVRVCCYNNARVFGIYPQKGVIRVGSDADIVIVDINKKVKLSSKNAHYAVADYCPYEGWEVKGWPVLTMLRGNILVEEDTLVAEPGIGRYIPRLTGGRYREETGNPART